MAGAPTSLAEGQEVAVLQPGTVTLRYDPQRPAVVFATSFLWADDPSIVILPGDARQALAAALDKAADWDMPGRCPACIEAPEPCETCRGDEDAMRRYRLWAALLRGVAVQLQEAGPGRISIAVQISRDGRVLCETGTTASPGEAAGFVRGVADDVQGLTDGAGETGPERACTP